jgi:cation:H+ antiporter
MVVGLTIVAYGTSLPEFVVSLLATSREIPAFAIGNIVGSNVANIGLVLGTAALVCPIMVRSRAIFRRDLPILALVTAAVVYYFVDGKVSPFKGAILLTVVIVNTILSLRTPSEEDHVDDDAISKRRAITLLIIGMGGLVLGAHFMVEGGSEIAKVIGISERVIALTVVAVGTSLPELAAAVASAAKGHPGLAVGNVVGSCLFNLAFVLGATAMIHPLPVSPEDVQLELVTMCSLTVVMWLMLGTKRGMRRLEGGLLVASYVGFLTYLVLTTVRHI